MKDKDDIFKELGSTKDRIGSTRMIYSGVVRRGDDPNGQGRLKVEIKDLQDRQVKEESLPWTLPLVPPAMHDLPQEGEGVMVMLADPDRPYMERYWFRRLIADYSNISFAPYSKGIEGTVDSRSAPTRKPPNTYPTSDYKDVWLVGRNNADVRFGENSLEAMAGFRDYDDIRRENLSSPSKMRLVAREEGDSLAMLLSDKILLLSNKSRPKADPLLSLENIDRLLGELYSIPKGEVLVSLLRVFRDAIISHTHKYHNQKADPENSSIERLKEANIPNILSDNHKIN